MQNKKGSTVLQTLMIIALMGSLAVTAILGINNSVIDMATETNNSILNSNRINVDYLIQNGF